MTKLLKYWFESRGELVMPDGRGRRGMLKQKHMEPPLYQRIADEVMVLYRQEKLLQDIADTLRVDRNTVTAAIRWWHEIRGLPVPDGRTGARSWTSRRPQTRPPGPRAARPGIGRSGQAATDKRSSAR